MENYLSVANQIKCMDTLEPSNSLHGLGPLAILTHAH